MSLNNFIKDGTIEKLKCDLCHNHLSYFPICMSNDKNICGRFYLHPQQESELKVNKVFETLAEFIQFPCQYEEEGCSEKYFPKDIIEHEKTCSFRSVKCPTRHFTACNWEGVLPTVLDHCQNMHNDLILNEGNFELNLAVSYQHENLFEHDSALFLVAQNFTSLNKLMELKIRYPDYDYDIKENSWKITFETTNRKLEIRTDTQLFEDHKNTMIYLDNFVDNSDSHEIKVKGKIMVDKKIENKSELTKEKNDEFLALLKCSSCSNYAQPPIYEVTVTKGQRDKRIQCSECRSKSKTDFTVQGVRNYTLDRLAEKLTFPCKNQINGCTFKSKPSSARNHRFSCAYREYDCPVSKFASCNWKGFGYDLPNHIEQVHSDLILKTSTLVIEVKYSHSMKKLILTDDKITCHIVKFLNCYFRLICFQNSAQFYWDFQLIGPNYNKDYSFEFEIIISDINVIDDSRLKDLKKDLLKKKHCYFHSNKIRDFIILSAPCFLIFNVKVFY